MSNPLHDAAHDVATTSGTTIRMILNDPEAMEFLSHRLATLPEGDSTGFTLADHVKCAQTELDEYDRLSIKRVKE